MREEREGAVSWCTGSSVQMLTRVIEGSSRTKWTIVPGRVQSIWCVLDGRLDRISRFSNLCVYLRMVGMTTYIKKETKGVE